MIPDCEITVDNIEHMIHLFNTEYGVYDEVLIRLFGNADNTDHDNVFCRVGLLDLIYNTGIQRFNKGGIETVTNHIKNLAGRIDSAKKADGIDFELYKDLKKVEYAEVTSTHGEENQIPVFASKFLSFTNPDVYPIMDSIVKNAIGYSGDDYKEFYTKLSEFKTDKINKLNRNKKYSLKDIDKFLWMWGKDKSKG